MRLTCSNYCRVRQLFRVTLCRNDNGCLYGDSCDYVNVEEQQKHTQSNRQCLNVG